MWNWLENTISQGGLCGDKQRKPAAGAALYLQSTHGSSIDFLI